MNIREGMKIALKRQHPQKLIIDTHGGIQDILAIVFAYKYIKETGDKQQILGITCVNGKNSLQKAVKSALIANKILGTKIPVYRGQKQTLTLRTQYPETYLSQNFTQLEQALEQQLEQDIQNWNNLVQPQKAVDFITRVSRQHKGKVGIAVFGPATNLALSHRLQEEMTNLKVISLTGGQYMGMGNTVKGNVQANFAFDPLAASIIFKTAKNSQLKDKLFINVIQQTLTFCWKQAINSCLDTGKLDPAIDQIFVNLMGINSIVLNCGPLLTIIPLLQASSVHKLYHCYGQIIQDGGDLDGLLAINWLKITSDITQFDSFFYVYEDFDKQLITAMFVKAFVKKDEAQKKQQNIQLKQQIKQKQKTVQVAEACQTLQKK